MEFSRKAMVALTKDEDRSGGENDKWLFNPKQGESHIVRIVRPKGSTNPMDAFFRYKLHYVNKRPVACTGKGCMVCKVGWQIWHDTKEASLKRGRSEDDAKDDANKERRPLADKDRYLSYVEVRTPGEKHGLKLLSYPKTAYQQLINIMFGKEGTKMKGAGDITDPETGLDVIFSKVKESGKLYAWPGFDRDPNQPKGKIFEDPEEEARFMQEMEEIPTFEEHLGFLITDPEEINELLHNYFSSELEGSSVDPESVSNELTRDPSEEDGLNGLQRLRARLENK